MLKRPEQLLKLFCLLLGAVLVLEVARVAAKGKPLKSLTIPALPTFASAAAESTNSTTATTKANGTNAAGATNAAGGTNPATAKTDTKETNKAPEQAATGTNVEKGAVGKSTNASESALEAAGTNLLASSTSTNGVKSNSISSSGTNVAVITATNAAHGTSETSGTNKPDLATAKTGTNVVANESPGKTNLNDKTGGNNAAVAQKARAKPPGPGGRPETAKKAPEVAPSIKARIDRITQSEILAPVMRPMPMALLGIAGDEALIRSPEGQTGMLKEGKELGSIKLLKIGTNRVLIEEKGEKKELTIFSGFGGESLMPKEEKKIEEAKKDVKTEHKKPDEKDKKPDEPTKKSA